MAGYPDGTFGPEDPVTREQLAAVLYRYAGTPSSNSDLEFTDAPLVSGYAESAMGWAVEQGILTGKPGRLLDPKGVATRAEAAAVLARYLKK